MDQNTQFTCGISAPLLTVNSAIILPASMIGFRPADLKEPRYEHHAFSACGQAHTLSSEQMNNIENGHKLPTFQVYFKSVVGTEIFYEVQIIMCYPFAHKPEQIPVTLEIATGQGNVVLLDGVNLNLIPSENPTIFCCAERSGYAQYIYRQFPTCSLASIIDSVWFEPPETETHRRLGDWDPLAGRPYLRLVVSGTFPVPVDDESVTSALKSHMDSMKSLFRDGTLSDVTVNGIPCHKAILASQSDVFHVMLTSDMNEKNSGEIVLEESKEVVESLLKFIYYCDTSELDTLGEEAIVELIQLGHRLNIPALVQSSVKNLMARPGEDSALDSSLMLNLFDFSQKAELTVLENTVISIFKRRQAENPDLVQNLIQSNSELAARLLTKSLSNQTSIYILR